MTIKLHNSTKKVEHKNPSPLKRTELDKNRLFLVTWFLCPTSDPTQAETAWWGRICSLAALHGCSMFRFVGPDGLLSGWLGRVLSACYQMRRIRSHLAAAGPLTRWIHEVKWKMAIWITPNDMIPAHGSPPHHIWYPQTQTGGLMTEPHRDFGSVVELRSSKEIVASFGWLKDLPMKSDVLVNRLQLFIFFQLFFLFFMSTLSIFVGAACQCLSMVGHNCFHELIYHLRTPAGQTGPKSTLRSRNSACWNPSRWDIPSTHPAKYSYIQQKNRISKSPSPWKKTRNLLVSNFLRQSRALRKLTQSENELVIVQRSVQ